MTLYRTYRPQKLADLDSVVIRDRLMRLLSSSYTPHALLFSGPKGTGKTSAARIVAKILNCEKLAGKKLSGKSQTADIEPCNTCEHCLAISDGRHLDVLEIDAASNRGIDEIRELREKIKLAPVSARFKVYIIDEVHMLTNEAFNALLKTLEEPPVHAVFILATTEPEKLPQTIVSRCIRLTFQKATSDEIIHSLKRVTSGEKVKVDDDVLQILADASEGSFRDATKLLEQVITENALTSEKALHLLGRELAAAGAFLQILIKRDLHGALVYINDMIEKGVNFRYFTQELLRILHEVFLVQNNIGDDSPAKQISTQLTRSEVTTLIKLFSRVFVELKSASMPHLPLEIAVVEWCEGKIIS